MVETPRTVAFRSGYAHGYRDAVWETYEPNIAAALFNDEVRAKLKWFQDLGGFERCSPICPTCRRGYLGAHECSPDDIRSLIGALQTKLDQTEREQQAKCSTDAPTPPVFD